jgi:hypothetical protein
MCLVFAVSFLLSLANILYSIYHPRSRSLLQDILIGPIFSIRLAAISGLAFWTIWKGKRWARGDSAVRSLVVIVCLVRPKSNPVLFSPVPSLGEAQGRREEDLGNVKAHEVEILLKAGHQKLLADSL